MKSFQIIFYAISFLTGVASISTSIFVNVIHKKKLLKLFIGLDISLLAIQGSITLNMYLSQISNKSLSILIISRCLDILGTSFSSFCGLLFIHLILGKKITYIKKFVITLAAAIQFVLTAIYFINTSFIILKYIVTASLIGIILYEVILTAANFRQIADKDLKKYIIFFMTITIIFFPLLTAEYLRPYISFFKNFSFFKLLAMPTYFFMINIGTLTFTYKYFNSPAYLDNNKLTKYFIQKYHITNKETEVIELILLGLTYKEISEKLFVSKKTVDNHIQSIYKKLGVKSKIQLSNLIHSKEQ